MGNPGSLLPSKDRVENHSRRKLLQVCSNRETRIFYEAKHVGFFCLLKNSCLAKISVLKWFYFMEQR